MTPLPSFGADQSPANARVLQFTAQQAGSPAAQLFHGLIAQESAAAPTRQLANRYIETNPNQGTKCNKERFEAPFSEAIETKP